VDGGAGGGGVLAGGKLVTAFDPHRTLSFVALPAALCSMTMRFNVIVNSFEVSKTVIIASDYMVNCVSSRFVTYVTDSFIPLENN
jgi:hypothetical protein